MNISFEFVEIANFIKKLSQTGMKLSYLPVNVEEVDIKKFLKVNYYRLGIILDLDCDGREEFLDKVNIIIIFPNLNLCIIFTLNLLVFRFF